MKRSFSASSVLAAAVICSLPGCATPEAQVPASPPRPGSGVEEYRRLTCEASAAMLRALSWLEQVSAQADKCPPKLVTTFADQVEQLQIDSIRVRARAQAIQARGDAYFEAWAGNTNGMGEVPRPKPENLSQLRESFTRVKQASRQAGEAFRPFFSGLRSLRSELESNPVLETTQTRELIRKTREQGLEVLQKLGALEDELEALRPLVLALKPKTNQ